MRPKSAQNWPVTRDHRAHLGGVVWRRSHGREEGLAHIWFIVISIIVISIHHFSSHRRGWMERTTSKHQSAVYPQTVSFVFFSSPRSRLLRLFRLLLTFPYFSAVCSYSTSELMSLSVVNDVLLLVDGRAVYCKVRMLETEYVQLRGILLHIIFVLASESK